MPIKAYDDKELKVSDEAYKALSSITAVDKALSVPYIKLTSIDEQGKDKDPNSPPISFVFVSPPKFGASADDIGFRERPPASLESIKVSTTTSQGLIMVRKIEISATVHRPEIIFSKGEYKNWSDLILPGTALKLEYGWASQSKNDILNGIGFKDCPGIKKVIITVYNYGISIKQNGEIALTISAMENGERKLIETPVAADPKKETEDQIDKRNTATRREFQKKIDGIKHTTDGKRKYFALKDLLESLETDMTESIKKTGYTKLEMYVGNLNSRCPQLKTDYSKKPKDNSIGSFMIPVEVLKNLITKATIKGKIISIMDFIQDILGVMNEETPWDAGETKENKKISIYPSVKMKLLSVDDGNDGLYAKVVIIDQKSQYSTFATSDSIEEDMKSKTKDQVKDQLKTANIPFLTFGGGLSFIENANIDVMQDPQMKTILIQNAYNPSRNATFENTKVSNTSTNPSPQQMIFASSLNGSLMMIGNFVFDTFALIWIDFGVPAWDGLFNITEKEDSLSAGVFTSVVKVISAGNDPLNVRSIKKT